MFYVYVLKSDKDKLFYIGFSSDLQNRIKAHEDGLVLSTKNRRPLNLIYYEAYLNRKDAMGREIFLKSGSGHRFLKKQLVTYLSSI